MVEPMRASFYKIFNVTVPIVLPGMTQISVPRLVSAVAESGGLGLLATAALSPAEVEQSIDETREMTNGVFGIGIPLLLPDAREKAEVAIQQRVPVVNCSLGKSDWLIDRVHGYGGKVIATVTTEKHAQAALRAGADALMATGHEAAGHGSSTTSLVLVRRLAKDLDTHIIATGGFSDGHGLASALALGASAVAMGTRFAMTAESPLHPDSKLAIQTRSIDQTLSTDRFDGMDCRILNTPAARRIVEEPPSFIAAIRAARNASQQTALSRWTLYKRVLQKGPQHIIKLARIADAADAMRRALMDGDHVTGIQPAGQGIGMIDDLPDVASLIDSIMRDARSSLDIVKVALDNSNQR